MKKRLIYFFAGESSGDLHGSTLLRALRPLLPNHRWLGVGGPMMRAQGLSMHLPMEEFEVMGLSDVLGRLPTLWGHFRRIRDLVLTENPDAVVLIDYPGFNLRLAKALRAGGYSGKLIHYISPSVWAWGAHRVDQMAKNLDLLLTIFPFEQKYYAKSGLPVTFVGNPLAEYIDTHTYSELVVPETDQLVALFPGSRAGEIHRNLPEMLEAAALLKQSDPRVLFAISCAHPETTTVIHEAISNTPLKMNRDVFLVPKSQRYELMRSCRCALAKSGTVTLELALHGKPTVVVYNLSLLNRLYAKHVLGVKLPYYCIVNILAGREVFPELIEGGFDAENMAQKLRVLMADSSERQACLSWCEQVRDILQGVHASQNAAQAIAELLP